MKIELTYYKLTGKYYTSGEGSFDKEMRFHEIITMVQSMIANRQLPGIQDGTWDGFIRVVVTESAHDIEGLDHLFFPKWLELHVQSREAYEEHLTNKIYDCIRINEMIKQKK